MDSSELALPVVTDGPARLLVVDDDRDVCELVAEVFEAVGDLAVTACTDPRDALEHIQHRPVDVVLTDLFMGRYSGMDILEAVQENHPDAVVILMTGQPSVENALAAMRQGAYDYLLKPFDIHSLRRTVERGIERRRLWLENAHLSEIVALYQLSHAATSNVELQDLLRLAVNAVTAEFGPDLVALFTSRADGTLESETRRGDAGNESEQGFLRARDAQSQEALETGQPVVTAVPADPARLGVPVGPVACRVSYPVRIGERVVGLINFQCPPRPEPINAGSKGMPASSKAWR